MSRVHKGIIKGYFYLFVLGTTTLLFVIIGTAMLFHSEMIEVRYDIDIQDKLVIKCRESHCVEFLSLKDKTRLKKCSIKVIGKIRQFKEPPSMQDLHENNCDFMNGTGRDPVALVSPPGSGNTWVRGLLERATGFCTGYVECDYTMKMRGFIGENINSGSVLVVKTHLDAPHWIGGEMNQTKYTYYGSAIVLLRNPYDSIVAEWNRLLAFRGSKVDSNGVLRSYYSHTNVVISKEIWCKYTYEVPMQLHCLLCTAWNLRTMVLLQFSIPCLVKYYGLR